MSNTTKGFEVRDYFISIEKQYLNNQIDYDSLPRIVKMYIDALKNGYTEKEATELLSSNKVVLGSKSRIKKASRLCPKLRSEKQCPKVYIPLVQSCGNDGLLKYVYDVIKL